MRAVRLHPPGTVADLVLEQVEIPSAGAGEALVRVPAVATLGPDVADLAVGDRVWALTGFDRDGAAAEYALVPAPFLAPKPERLGHVESAAIPLAGLSAWQGLFEHGRLREGERVLVHGAAGGVGQFATQLARWRGAYVIGTSSSGAALEEMLALGADEALDRSAVRLEEAVAPLDLVFDTVGGDVLAHSVGLLREGGRIVSVAEEPPPAVSERVEAHYFVVEPSREQLVELARLVDQRVVRPLVDSVFPLAEARSAFERAASPGKRGKVVLQIG